MTSIISDTDLLDLSTDLFNEDMHTPDEETPTNKKQCTPKTDKELKNCTKVAIKKTRNANPT